jgi:small neutral amino acid transporter SnatA (MarC family)
VIGDISLAWLVEVFLLLLIGIGPKIALVPFLGVTERLDESTKGRVVRKMLVTAFVTALVLIVFGGLLTRLLHFSTGALGIASGLILLALSIPMVIKSETDEKNVPMKDPMTLAVSPLGIPYLLNPVGIVVLITLSAESHSLVTYGLVLLELLVLLAIDIVVFRWAKKVTDQLSESRMLVVEKVFGFLLAAVAVQLVLNGLVDLGLIHLALH